MSSWNVGEEFPPGLRHTPSIVGDFEVQSPEWLDARRGGIGASDSPSILGAPGAFSSCLDVWAQKVCEEPHDSVSESMAELFHFGHVMEPIIASELMSRGGYEVRPEPRTLCHPEKPFIQANLDSWACVNGVWGPAEFKNVTEFSGDQWDYEVPLKYQVQTQHQMYVTGAEIAVAAALIGGRRFKWTTIERDDNFIDAMVDRLTVFWGMVTDNIQPVASDEDVELLKSITEIDEDLSIVLPFEAIHWAYQIAGAKEEKKEWESLKRMAEARVLQAMGEAAVATLPDGSGTFRITVNKNGTKTLRYKEEK